MLQLSYFDNLYRYWRCCYRLLCEYIAYISCALWISPINGRTYAMQNSLLRPALAHITRLALANSMWKRFMFLAMPRYATFA